MELRFCCWQGAGNGSKMVSYSINQIKSFLMDVIIAAFITVLGNIAVEWYRYYLNPPSAGGNNSGRSGTRTFSFNGIFGLILTICICYFHYHATEWVTGSNPISVEWVVLFWVLTILIVYRLFRWRVNTFLENTLLALSVLRLAIVILIAL